MFSKIYGYNIKNLAKLAANALSKYANNHDKRNILFLIATGSSFEILNFIDNKILSQNITIAVLDERYSDDLNVNNFAQLQKTKFYKTALKAKCNFINSFPLSHETHEHLAMKINSDIKDWLSNNPRGKVIATIGIGTDGHIGGIMPNSKESSLYDSINKESSILKVDTGGKNKYNLRITPNIKFFQKNIDKAVVYVVGNNKKNVLYELIKANARISALPSKILLTMKNVTLFTDIYDLD